jgi:tetratricopeptide (TPR) repeat protein
LTRPNLRLTILALGVLAAAAPARAQSPAADPIQEGYRLLYSGEKGAAVRHFDDLLTARPDDLPARYGWLMAERPRLNDAARRPAFEKALDAFITLADKRYDKSSQDAEALFYLAQSHLMRGEYRFSYDKGMFGAARDGANAKSCIETYIKQHPENGDAYFVLGMYNYYVDILPTFAHFMRFLLFLPGGNRVEGLKQIERAAAQGPLFGPIAKTILLDIYSSLEGRGTDAVTVGEQLQRQFPTNDELAFKVAGIYAGPLVEDRARAAVVYQGILDRRRGDKSTEWAGSQYNAILGLANLRRDEWRIDEAIAMLAPTIDAKVGTPDWVLPQFLIRRASYRAVLNDPAAGEDAQRVLNDPQLGQGRVGATNVLKQIEDRKASGEAVAVASLVPGNRLVAEGKWDEAQRAYEPLRARDPQNPWIRYRLAFLDFSRGRTDAALPVFTALSAGGKIVAENIRAQSLLHIGRIHDLAGRRADARKAYQKVVDDFPKLAAASTAKVGLITPYHRPVTIVASGT